MTNPQPSTILASWPCRCGGVINVREAYTTQKYPATPFVAQCDKCNRWWHKIDLERREQP